MKRIVFAVLLFIGLFLLIGNVYADPPDFVPPGHQYGGQGGDSEANALALGVGIGVGFGGEGGNATIKDVEFKNTNTNLIANNNENKASASNYNYSPSTSKAIGLNWSDIKVSNEFAFNYVSETPMDTPQMPSQQPMPIIQNGKIFPYPDMPDFDGIKPYDKAKEDVVNVKVVTWKWNIADTFAFSWITYTNAIETVIEEFNKSKNQEAFRFSVMCLDGSVGYGSQGGLVGSLLDGKGGGSGGLFPGINRSDYDPKCPVKIYQVVNKK